MSANIMSQKQYLQKYLSKNKKRKKKDKISSSTLVKRSQIIDDDENDLIVKGDIEDEEYSFDHLGDEAPQIAGIVDERPLEVRSRDHYDQNHWKDVGKSDSTDPANKPQSGVEVSKLKNNTKESNSLSLGSSRTKNNIESDVSPPRSSTLEKLNMKNAESDSDYSPPRVLCKKRESSSDVSPPRVRPKSKYSSDESPPRSRTTDALSRRKRKSRDSDSDMSPVRGSRKSSNRKTECSPIRESAKSKSHNNKRVVEESNKKVKRKQSRKDSDSDASPPRSKSKKDRHYKDKKESGSSSGRDRGEGYSRDDGRKRYSDSDESPPRSKDKKERHNSKDIKNKRSSKRDDSRYENSNSSGDRLSKSDSKKDRVSSREYDGSKNKDSHKNDRHKSDPDGGEKQTKSKNNKDSKGKSTKGKKDNESNTKSDKMERTLDGKRAGLQNAGNLKEELMTLKQKEEQMFKEMASNLSGEGAAPVMRDRKTGKKRDLEKEKQESIINSAKQAEKNEKYYKWGKGLKQVEDSEKKISDALHEMSKPLARYANDVDLDNFLKAQEREGDPMLDYIRQKQAESINVNEPSKPKYKGSFMPNRFGIAPGYRWDGVDRSNGYEKSWFEHRNAKKAIEEEAYKWSTSDM